MVDGDSYVIWGSAGHAKVLASTVALLRGRVVALIDNDPQAVSALAGVPLYVGEEGLACWIAEARDSQDLFGLAAIGGARGRDRLAVQELFRAHGIQVKPLVHPEASVCNTASLGAGTQVLAHALVAADAQIGEGCIVNHGASIDHEYNIGNGVHLAPGSTLCGCVTVGDNVMIGANAVVLPRVTIAEDTIIGAGAVVTRDLPAGVIAMGNPARIRRCRQPDDRG